MMRELERQHGAAFDRLYRRDMLEDHVSDIEEYRRRMQETRSPAIRRYVERTLPVLRRHLQLAIVMSTKSWAYAHRRYRPR
jgi:putative membrane protein